MFEENFDTIFRSFKGADAVAWKDRIIADLKGKAFENLVSTTEDGIEILPFYTAPSLWGDKGGLNIPPKKEKYWLMTEYIKVEEVQKANADALFALQNGMNAIVFDLQKNTLNASQVAALVKDFFDGAVCVYAENTGATDAELLKQHNIFYHKKLYVPQQKSTVNELLYAVQNLFLNDAETTNVHFCIGHNYFLEIAKLKTFRWLVEKIGELQKTDKNYVLFAETGFENRNDDCIENNILRNTTEAMSAILGGCDALMIHPHENSNLGRRVARNIHQLLYYESRFKDLPDAVKGTYYIDYLTFKLAEKVWEKLG
jgi:methylmalonyl-CoA mutase